MPDASHRWFTQPFPHSFGWKRAALSATFIYTAVQLIVYLGADLIIFQPPPAGYRDSSEIIKINTADGRTISALYLTNDTATYAILCSHGNAEDLGGIRPLLEEFRTQGFAVMSYDYAGYGTSPGRPSTGRAYRDAEAALAYLVRQLKTPPARIIVFGRSLGGGLATHLAARNPVGGLILESTFVSAFRVLTRYPVFVLDKFRNLARIRAVRCPVLIINGAADPVIPPWHGRALFEAAGQPKRCLWVAGAGHDDVAAVAGERYWRTIAAFRDLIAQRRSHALSTLRP